MAPITLEDLERTGLARVEADRLVFMIAQEWAATGERRIGYVGILRLVECVREFHWRNDVLPAAVEERVDSITRSISADFLSPVEVSDQIVGRYRIRWCRRRSYQLEVVLSSQTTVRDLVRVGLVSVFFDPMRMCSTVPPASVAEALQRRAATVGHP